MPTETVLDVAQNDLHKDKEFAERVLEDTQSYYKILAAMLQRCMEERGQAFVPESEFSARTAIVRSTVNRMAETLALDDEEKEPIREQSRPVEVAPAPVLRPLPVDHPIVRLAEDTDEFERFSAMLDELDL